MIGFDTRELDQLERNILKTAQKELPKETKAFLRKEGSKLRKVTRSIAKAKVGKQTGNYHKSIKRGKVYKYRGNGAWSIRAYSGAPHAHLIEDGHRQVTKDGKEVGFVQGKHVFEAAVKRFDGEFYDDTQDFIEEVLEKGF